MAIDSSNRPQSHGEIHVTLLAPGVAQWTLHHPSRRNAVTPSMLRQLADLAQAATGGAVILASCEADFFCAGFDLAALATTNESPDLPLITATLALRHCAATLIARLDGQVLGAGVEVASACDLMVATPATTLRIPAGELGVVYHGDGLDRLSQAFGVALTRRLILSGESVSAEDPQARPAFCRVVARERLAAETLALAQSIAAMPNRARQANAMWLRQVPGIRGSEQQRDHERARTAAYQSDEHRQALQRSRPLRTRNKL